METKRMPTVREHARSLLHQYLRVLAAKRNHTSALYLRGNSMKSGDFGALKTWINIDVGNAARANNSIRTEQLFEFIQLVGELSSAKYFELRWRDCYHSFWKRALMESLDCGFCNRSAQDDDSYDVHPTQFDDREQLLKSDGPRFMLDFSNLKGDDDGNQQPNQLDLLRDWLLQQNSQSPGLEHASLLSRLTPARPALTQSPCVELGVALSSKKLATSSDFRALAALLNDITEHQQQKAAGDTNRVRYEVATLLLPPDKPLSPIELDILTTDVIACEGSTIRHLHFRDARNMLSVAERFEGFQRLLCTSVCGGGSLHRSQPTLETLSLKNVPLRMADSPSVPHNPLASICSALRYPNSLRNLDLDWAFDELAASGGRDTINTELLWAWIAFGIFHPDSTAQLDRITLSALPLNDDDMDCFVSVLRTPHPGERLWRLEYGDFPDFADNGEDQIALPKGQRTFVQLHATVKLSVQPTSNARALESAGVLMDRDEFEVALEFTNWVCVVVPGCGFGWTLKSSIEARRTAPSKCPDERVWMVETRLWGLRREDPLAAAPGNVKIFYRYDLARMNRVRHDAYDDIADVMQLLRMIGHGLTGLNYVSHGIYIRDEDLRQILDACPNLTSLNLMNN